MRTSYAAYQDIRHHYEDADPADCTPEPTLRHCSGCGGFLTQAPLESGFNVQRDTYYEERRCTRCGKVNQEWML